MCKETEDIFLYQMLNEDNAFNPFRIEYEMKHLCVYAVWMNTQGQFFFQIRYDG